MVCWSCSNHYNREAAATSNDAVNNLNIWEEIKLSYNFGLVY